jgi:signal transduction histidine kinase
VIQNAPIGMLVLNRNDHIAYANQHFARNISKIKRTEQEGRHIKTIFDEKRWNDLRPLVRRAKKGETVIQGLIITVGDSVPYTYFLISCYPVKKTKTVTHVGIIFEDITYQRYVEAEWRRSKEELEVVLNHSASGIIVYDHEQGIILVNQTMRSMFHWHIDVNASSHKLKREDFIRNMSDKFILTDERNKQFDPHKLPALRVYKGEKEPEKIFKATEKDSDRYNWYHMKARPIYDTQKNLDMVLIIVHDISMQKEIDQRKDDFISYASHELKTPITTQHALLQLVQTRLKKKQHEGLEEYLDKMNSQIKRQLDLIDNLLDITKIRNNKIVYKFQDIAIEKVVHEVVSEFKLNHPSHTIRIEGKTKAHVKADRYRISQVLLNLLNNAAKYSPNTQEFVVHIKNQAMMVTIGVQDFGPGIPQEKIDSIFDRFYRVEDKLDNISGLGLGLYISYEIIKKHHGRLWVESAPREGSTFYFSIPKIV